MKQPSLIIVAASLLSAFASLPVAVNLECHAHRTGIRVV